MEPWLKVPLKISVGAPSVDEFISVKGFKAKGKRIAIWQIESIEELEPTRFPEETDDVDEDNNETEAEEDDDLDPDRGKSEQQVIDEITGQLNLFPDENE